MKKKIQEDSSPILVVSTEPLECTKQDDCVTEVPDVFTAWAVTWARSRAQSLKDSQEMVLTGFGEFFLFAMIMFFDKALLAIGYLSSTWNAPSDSPFKGIKAKPQMSSWGVYLLY